MSPRDSLVSEKSTEGTISLTPSVVEFLRTELRAYKATTRFNGNKWSDENLSREIVFFSSSDDSLSLSGETLRRFQKNLPQEIGDEKILAIANYLLNVEWISREDLKTHELDIRLKEAISLNTFFGIKPTATVRQLYEDLAGSYDNYGLAAGEEVWRTNLVVTIHREPLLLVASETIRVFPAIASVRMILERSRNLSPLHYDKVSKHFRYKRRHSRLRRSSSGFLVNTAHGLDQGRDARKTMRLPPCRTYGPGDLTASSRAGRLPFRWWVPERIG